MSPPLSSSAPPLPGVHHRPRALRRARGVVAGLMTLAALWGPGVRAQSEGGAAPCVDGLAGTALCHSIDRLAKVSTEDVGPVNGVEAWTDPVTGTEYAIVLVFDSTFFYDLSDPADPVLVARMQYPLGCCVAFPIDVAIFDDHAFLVGSQTQQNREVQIFDLTRLRSIVSPPEDLLHDAIYSDFDSASSVTANPETGFLYAGRVDTCSGGLHMIDVSNPTVPVQAGCYSDSGRIEMAQCVLYQGPDVRYQGREICFAANEDALLILDVEDKTQPMVISRTTYPASEAAHGSLTEDHAHFLLADAGDEVGAPHPTRTYLWDLADLEAPTVAVHEAATTSRDVQNTVRGQYVYQANLSAGVRILDLHDLANGRLDEVAFFDSVPSFDIPAAVEGGAWDLAITDSGILLVSGATPEFQVLQPNLCIDPPSPGQPMVQSTAGSTLQVDWIGEPGANFNVYRSTGECPGEAPELVASGLTSPTFTDTVAGQLEHSYVVTATAATGLCESTPSPCGSATGTGPCNAPPIFDGLRQVENPSQSSCQTHLSWDPATPRCGASVRYAVYRGETPDFVPSAATRIATALTNTTYTDFEVEFEQTSYYIVRALDTINGEEDGNTVAVAGSPVGITISAPWTAGAEAGDPDLSYPDGELGWRISSDDLFAGTASYHSGNEQTICSPLITPPLRLTAGVVPKLTFFFRYGFSIRLSGGVVEFSNDGGETWDYRQPVGSYPWSLLAGNVCAYPELLPAYTHGAGWQQDTFILTPWAGQEILIRWVYSSPTPDEYQGWFLDNIAVSHVDQPLACAPLLFGDGFESGDTAQWTATLP